MEELELPHAFRQYMRDFLSSRKPSVEMNDKQSRTIMLNEGLRQESSMSVELFLVFINDMGIELDTKTRQSLFTDDTAI